MASLAVASTVPLVRHITSGALPTLTIFTLQLGINISLSKYL